MFWTGFITGVICLAIGIVGVLVYADYVIRQEWKRKNNDN